MEILTTKTLSPVQLHQLNEMWNSEYPEKLSNRFNKLLEGVENFTHYLIIDTTDHIIAWAVVFEKDNELRFSIIVNDTMQGKGMGSKLIEKLKSEHMEFFGWVIDHNNDLKSNGATYRSPLPFYKKQGFTILNDQRIDTEMLNAVKVKWSTLS